MTVSAGPGLTGLGADAVPPSPTGLKTAGAAGRVACPGGTVGSFLEEPVGASRRRARAM